MKHFIYRKAVKDEVDGATPAKKIKSEKVDQEDVEGIKKQNKIMFLYRDQLKEQLKKKELEALLLHNSQAVPAGQEQVFFFLT